MRCQRAREPVDPDTPHLRTSYDRAWIAPTGGFTLAIPPSTGSGSADDPSTGDLDIDGLNDAPSPQITLTGMGPGVTTIDANQIDRIFTVHPGASLSISGVTLTNGLAPAANVLDPYDGGAVDSEGSLTISDSVLTHNAGGGEGGGVYSAAGDVKITDTTIAANTATTAGGGLADGGTGVVTLIDDTFDTNDSAPGAASPTTASPWPPVLFGYRRRSPGAYDGKDATILRGSSRASGATIWCR